MTELSQKAVDKFNLVSEAMLELEKTDNWFSKELNYLNQRKNNFGIKDYEYYQLFYQLKGIVMNIILESLK
jgi:hypothetical protein